MEIQYGDAHCEITMQHLNYGSIIGGGQTSPHSILKMCESARASAAKLTQDIADKAEESYQNMFFIKWQQIEILPQFYYKTTNSQQGGSYIDFINRKITLHHQLLPIGKSSQFLEDTVVDHNTKDVLLLSSVLRVNIDPATRRPTAFSQSLTRYFTPERCAQRYKIQRSAPQCQKEYPCLPYDGRIFTSVCKISASQTDRNNHVNQAVYANLCYDCLGDAFAATTFGKKVPYCIIKFGECLCFTSANS